MTKLEIEIKQLAEVVGDLRTVTAVLIEKIDHMVDQRTSDGSTALGLAALLSNSCKERHEAIDQRIDHLERSERRSYGLRNKLTGMAIPLGLIVAISLGLVGIFLR